MKAREHVDLTQEEMAEKLTVELGRNVSKQTVSNWENDSNQPRKMAEVIQAYARITSVDEAWLLGFRTGSFSSAVLQGLPSSPTPELPFPPADRRLSAV